IVEVGCGYCDVGRRGLPYVEHGPVGAATRARRGLRIVWVTDHDIDVHRKVELGLAGGGDLVDVARHVPGVEGLVRLPVEHLRPCAASADLVRELRRNWPGEQAVRLRGEIA